jgi:hypothetical protein
LRRRLRRKADRAILYRLVGDPENEFRTVLLNGYRTEPTRILAEKYGHQIIEIHGQSGYYPNFPERSR